MIERLSPKIMLLDGEPTHYCPGCRELHLINVKKPNSSNAQWTWNGNAEKPTFHPSINRVGLCHYFIRGGMIEFCADSTHKLAGQTIELPDIPAEWLDMDW